MQLLIDGYNLLFSSDIFGAEDGSGGLAGSREALLDFLVKSLSEKERKQTTIIFDATDAPRNLPARSDREGIRVLFARDYDSGDTMIEEILESAKGRKNITVVSSDHRLHRAARGVGAKGTDSSLFLAELRQRNRNLRRGSHPEKPQGPISSGEVDYWTEQFLEDSSSNEESSEE